MVLRPDPMGLFLPNKRANYRRFSYEPRFWNPEKEERLKRRIRVKRHVKRRPPAGVLYFALLLIIAAYMFLHL